jgi:vanillate O-demethylase ferredoxin subunit
MTKSPLIDVVVKKRELQGNGRVAVLDLAAVDGSPLPAFTAGAYVDLHITPSLARQYSLCGDPADTRVYRLGILRKALADGGRGGSLAAHEQLREGVATRISAPRNLFPLAADARRSLLIGGGIGITPMLAMAHALHTLGQDFEVHYCAHSRSDCAFVEELRQAAFHDRVRFHFSDETRILLPEVLGHGEPGLHLYVCGPVGFMNQVLETAHARGYADDHLHRECFQAEVDNQGECFTVVAAKSGKTVEVKPGQSILDALTAVGVKVQKSCEKGICGACQCTVLEGEPDHRDVYLTDEEKADNDLILVCCSRAKSRQLVLDI